MAVGNPDKIEHIVFTVGAEKDTCSHVCALSTSRLLLGSCGKKLKLCEPEAAREKNRLEEPLKKNAACGGFEPPTY